MAVPVLNLNLAPQPSLWRQQHRVLGWATLAAGSACLVTALGFTWRAYHQAGQAGRDAVNLTTETRRATRQQQELQATLQTIDATREQARWRQAERILQERSLPWSRLTTELERCMVPDMRLRGIQRVRGSAQQVVMKLKGEARTVAAENAFIDALRHAPVFEQVILERENERQGGGWDFELTLPVVAVPPPFAQEAPKPPAAAKASAPAPLAPVPAAPAPAPKTAAPRPPAPALRPGGASKGVVERTAPPERRFPPIRRPRHGSDDGDSE